MSFFDCTSYELTCSTESFSYRSPMKFGGRVVNDVTLLNVLCTIENARGITARGFGSMTMGVVWAWPSRLLDPKTILDVVVELGQRLVRDAAECPVQGHPLRVCMELAKRRGEIAAELGAQRNLPEPIPPLAQLLAASPLEAAIFDAHGKAAGKSCYQLLGREHLGGDLSEFLGDEFRGVWLDQLIASEPAPEMPLYHLVGALDRIFDTDPGAPIGDGLPESLQQWIRRDSLTHLKIKLDGADGEWDCARVLAVDQCASMGPRGEDAGWSFSLDFNERCENADYVLRLLDAIEKISPRAMGRIQYLEQPTARDLGALPEKPMHRVAQRLPVVIDESLVDYASLLRARELGYSGVAIKACKGHAEALLMAAAARHHGMFLCVQDLTCVGASFLHSAALTAHLPGAAAIEGNGRQYAPAANERWEDYFPGLFNVRGGTLPTARLCHPGLGYEVPEELLQRAFPAR